MKYTIKRLAFSTIIFACMNHAQEAAQQTIPKELGNEFKTFISALKTMKGFDAILQKLDTMSESCDDFTQKLATAKQEIVEIATLAEVSHRLNTHLEKANQELTTKHETLKKEKLEMEAQIAHATAMAARCNIGMVVMGTITGSMILYYNWDTIASFFESLSKHMNFTFKHRNRRSTHE